MLVDRSRRQLFVDVEKDAVVELVNPVVRDRRQIRFRVRRALLGKPTPRGPQREKFATQTRWASAEGIQLPRRIDGDFEDGPARRRLPPGDDAKRGFANVVEQIAWTDEGPVHLATNELVHGVLAGRRRARGRARREGDRSCRRRLLRGRRRSARGPRTRRLRGRHEDERHGLRQVQGSHPRIARGEQPSRKTPAQDAQTPTPPRLRSALNDLGR